MWESASGHILHCMHVKVTGQFSGVSSHFPSCWRFFLFLLLAIQANWLVCFQMILSLPPVLLWLQMCTTTSVFYMGSIIIFEFSGLCGWCLYPLISLLTLYRDSFSLLKSHLFIICMWCMYVGQRTTCVSGFSLSTMWVSGIKHW